MIDHDDDDEVEEEGREKFTTMMKYVIPDGWPTETRPATGSGMAGGIQYVQQKLAVASHHILLVLRRIRQSYHHLKNHFITIII